MKNYPVSRKDNLVVQEMDGEVMIYDLTENKAFCLNETSALVWQACDGSKSASEISELVCKELNSPKNEDMVWFALDQLKAENLLANEADLISPFVGMSRRAVIKKIGLGSMIALPIVASMISPMAIHAASCTTPSGNMDVNPGCPCIITQDCLPSVMCTANPMGVLTCAGL